MRQSNQRVGRGLLVATLVGSACDNEASRPVEGRSTQAASVRPPAVPNPAAERSAARPRGRIEPREPAADAGLWAACHHGFRTQGRPRVDVTRLGMLCGPANGMTRAGPIVTGKLNEEEDAVLPPVEVASPECWRVFAAAGGDIRDLELEVRAVDGRSLALDRLEAAYVVTRPAEPLCLEQEGKYQARLRTHAGDGSYALQIWRYKM